MASGPIITLSYTTSPSGYIRMAMGEVLARYRWSITLPLTLAIVTLLAAGTFCGDIRYMLIALILIFIVVPGLLALAYFSAALTPTAAMCVLPRHLIIIPGKQITVVYEPFRHRQETVKPHAPAVVEWNAISGLQRHGSNTIVTTDAYSLIIPDSILPCPSETLFEAQD